MKIKYEIRDKKSELLLACVGCDDEDCREKHSGNHGVTFTRHCTWKSLRKQKSLTVLNKKA